MTSFRKPTTSKRSRFWNEPRIWIPLLVFLALELHGSLLGLSDDEAYYWVLAQKPSLGYAFHPPAVAWVIALFQGLLGWLFGKSSPGLVRLPAVLSMSGMIYLVLAWFEEMGAPRKKLAGAGCIVLAFAGMSALSWMIVPDLPLFFGLTLALVSVWRICFGRHSDSMDAALAALGVALAVLSKYSGVLVFASALGAIWFLAPSKRRWQASAWVAAGLVLGMAPALIWNARHDWASLLYQIRDRHSEGSVSFVRYIRFWGAELLSAGPVLIGAFFLMMRRARKDPFARFMAIWALPPAVIYLSQPLWSDFKPHWAFVVWWVAVIWLAWVWMKGELAQSAKLHLAYGLGLGAIVLLSCHFPLTTRMVSDPRFDVTNDFYGWAGLRGFLESNAAAELPVIGGRYQTASQAAFALGGLGRATMIPRDLKALDEWPDLRVSDSQGPEWPALTAPVLFVADNRYGSGPEFKGASCEKLGRLETRRSDYLAKWIDVWKCAPGGSRP